MADPEPRSLPTAVTLAVQTQDGHAFELIWQATAAPPRACLYWLPAMGVPARHYVQLASQLAAHGVAVLLHEWRGIGSSRWRAGRRRDWAYRQLVDQDLAAGLAQAAEHVKSVPLILGGHSLGGQLSVLYASLQPRQIDALLLIGSGAPYWRHFRWRYALRVVYQLAPGLSQLIGYFPGRRLGFGGNEARGVIADWARSGREGCYLDPASGQPLAIRTQKLELPLLALLLAEDPLAPAASLAHLLAPMQRVRGRVQTLDAVALGLPKADHFSWMQQPQGLCPPIQDWLASWLSDTADDRHRSAL